LISPILRIAVQHKQHKNCVNSNPSYLTENLYAFADVRKVIMFLCCVCSFIRLDRPCYHVISWMAEAISVQLTVNIH